MTNFSDDGTKLAVADKANCIHTFNTDNYTLIEKLYSHRTRITRLAWSTNGWLASGKVAENKLLIAGILMNTFYFGSFLHTRNMILEYALNFN